MKTVTANGKKKIVMTRKEWEAIGKKAGWENDFERAQYKYDNRMPPEESGPFVDLRMAGETLGDEIAALRDKVAKMGDCRLSESDKNRLSKLYEKWIEEKESEIAEIDDIIKSGDVQRANGYIDSHYGPGDDPT